MSEPTATTLPDIVLTRLEAAPCGPPASYAVQLDGTHLGIVSGWDRQRPSTGRWRSPNGRVTERYWTHDGGPGLPEFTTRKAATTDLLRARQATAAPGAPARSISSRTWT